MAGKPTQPASTYRVQLHAGFGFAQTAAIADYLADLGISHQYVSPYLQAVPGSRHGYDTVDPTRLADELGGAEGHQQLCAALRRHGLGQVLDIVPNHMGIAGAGNAWWQDVLARGQSSPFASYFDIDWAAPEAKLHGKVLLPVLGDHFGRVLQARQIQLRRADSDLRIVYFDHVWPVDFCTLGSVMGPAAERCGNQALAYIADAMGAIQPRQGLEKAAAMRCARDRDVLKAQLGRLLEEDPAAAAAVDGVIAEINDNPDALDALLSRQHYRLACWKTAGQELNYRRFFDINTLIGLHIEDEPVFAATHSLILPWVREGLLDGLRIDHPDGLRDPEEYLSRLAGAAGRAWIVVEKVLAPGERLRDTWPVDGTTGYDFLNLVGGLFIDPSGENPLTDFYQRFTGETTEFASLARRKKHLVLTRSFGGELSRLTSLFAEICEKHRQYRDYTRIELRDALAETLACLGVYRTYSRPDVLKQANTDDVRYVGQALDAALAHRPDLDERLLRFLADVLLLQIRGDTEGELTLRFQQLSGPVMAKAVEDTAFYCYNRLVCLNEVGGDPGRFGVSLEMFHRECLRLQENWPHTMTTTGTHDTKRGEDVRSRIALLSGIPDRWIEAVQRWADRNSRYRTQGWPDRNTEYLFYQTLVGAWPISAERLTAYMQKAVREAKVHTSWTDPNPPYEDAVQGFVQQVLKDATFLEDFEAFVKPLVPLGRINSLAMALVKFTAPGVPDLYQGDELWDLNLVDPDNRRPVDYDRRRCLLGELDRLDLAEINARADEGLPKLWLTRQALRLRRQRADVFADGDYAPLQARGPHADHLVAFSRGGQVVTVAPRLVLALDNWADTQLELPRGHWHNELTGQEVAGPGVRPAELLEPFPVALLVRR